MVMQRCWNIWQPTASGAWVSFQLFQTTGRYLWTHLSALKHIEAEKLVIDPYMHICCSIWCLSPESNIAALHQHGYGRQIAQLSYSVTAHSVGWVAASESALWKTRGSSCATFCLSASCSNRSCSRKRRNSGRPLLAPCDVYKSEMMSHPHGRTATMTQMYALSY